MRRFAIGFGVVLAIAVAWAVSEHLAAETGEVVVVRTFGPDGVAHETRLWIVDDAGASWLRAGDPKSGWFLRLEAKPDIEVVRGGRTLAVRATPVPEAQARINALMAEKYGFSNRYIGLFFPRSRATPVRLDPR